MNIVIDVNCFVEFMLFSAPSYAKSDVGYYVINHGVYIRRSHY